MAVGREGTAPESVSYPDYHQRSSAGVGEPAWFAIPIYRDQRVCG